jgi:two-component system OmpR family response regulator
MQKHILLVEDEDDIREAMAEALRDASFEVTTASNGADALKLAVAKKPDLILLDIVMPEMDGQETLRRLRSDPWGAKAKVIMLTSMDNAKNVATAHESAITDYIIKVHSSLDEIVRRVRIAVHAD